MSYPTSPTLLEVWRELEALRRGGEQAFGSEYNGVNADDAGDSSAAGNRIDSTIPPADQLSPGSVGGLRSIEGIVR